MAFKPRPPRPEEAKSPEKGPKVYKIKPAPDPEIPPPQTLKEMGERIVVIEQREAHRKGRPSDLRRHVQNLEARVELLEAILRKEKVHAEPRSPS